MKKFYSIFVMAIAMLAFATQANAASITLNVDNASAVDVQINYETVTLESGVDTEFDIEDGTYIYVMPKEGFLLESANIRGMEYTDGYFTASYWSNSCYSAADYDGRVYDIKTINLAEARDGEVTVKVDDASLVKCELSNTYTTVNLVNGENKVKYISDGTLCELPISFSCTNYDKNLYKVTLNGEDIAADNYSGCYNVYPTSNDDVIEVKALFPDQDVPVKFTYGEGADGFISTVLVDGSEVTNYNDDDFTVKLGSKITIYGNTNSYKFESMTVNDENITSFYSSYEFFVLEDEYNITINAHPYGTITAYVTVDNIDNVTLYRGYSSYNDVITLESGVKTAVEISEANPLISWTVAAGCFIESVTVNTGSEVLDRTGYSSLSNIAEGTEIVITTGVIVRDQTAILWIDDKSLAQSYSSFSSSFDRAFHSFAALNTGYNEVVFSAEVDNPFGMSLYSTNGVNPIVYQNDEIVVYKYGYEVTMADQDVIKIFFATAEPATYNVTFEAAENIPTFTCKKDIITDFDWQTGTSVLQGTQIDIVAEEALKVTVNDNAVEAGEGNTYSFVVNADTVVKLVADTDALENVEIDAVKNNNVYNLQGILVVKNASAEQIEALPAGMYIINGSKVVLK